MARHSTFFKEVMFLDKWTCVYCGLQSKDLQIDHYIPQSKGGPNCIDNLYACCKPCNLKKKDRPMYKTAMIPRFGRFQYVTDWVQSLVISEAARLQLETEIHKAGHPSLTLKLWRKGIIPTVKPLTESETVWFWAMLAIMVPAFLIICFLGISFYPSVFVPFLISGSIIFTVCGLLVSKHLAFKD